MSSPRMLASILLIPVALWISYCPLRLAYADDLSRAADAGTVTRAVRLVPGSAEFRLRLADVQEAAGSDPTEALLSAAALDPANAETWVRLGLAAELRGDFRTAESRLIEAAHVSRLFAPRWALANYYFRRNDSAHFWPWIKEALSMAYGDLSPAFQLCWQMTQDPAQIDRTLPQTRVVLNAYLQYLLAQNHLTDSARTAAQLAAIATPNEKTALISFCDRQIDSGSAAAAVQVWNALCSRHLLPYAPFDAVRASLTDGDFAAPLLEGGFGWRTVSTAGVIVGRNMIPPYLWITFSGDQPEHCAPLEQFVPVTPGITYRLRFEYHTTELPRASGLRWSAYDVRRHVELAADSPWLSSLRWEPADLRFTASASGLVRLALTYDRQPGSTRMEGSLDLQHMRLERAP